MADITTKCISLALYQYMCQNIVGSEDYVRTIRMLITVRDNLITNDSNVVITGGSFGEGLDLRRGDIDIVQAHKCIDVSEERKFAFDFHKTYLKMETETIHAGYTMLHLIFSQNSNEFQLCKELNGKYYFSNALFKQKFLDSKNRVNIIHGPCLSTEQGDYDFAHALHSEFWISAAENWITRSTNLWPSYVVKQSIVKHGVLFVPVGYNGSPREELQWRISFNVGEKLLIYTFTHTQLLCYCLMKILLKDVINEHMDVEYHELLCSYILKTVVFWISEEMQPSIWKPTNLIPCFMGCFKRLIYYVEFSVCPHYFIPQNDLFENRVKGRAREVLLNALRSFYRHGWRCFKFSKNIFCLQVRRFYTEPCIKYLERIKLNFSELIRTDAALLNSYNHLQKAFTGMHPLLSYKNPKIVYLNIYSLSMICSQKAQTIRLTGAYGNKNCYLKYKACQYNLMQNIYHDAASGWLLIASFFYKRKQYNKAMYIISNCVIFKLYPNSEMIHTFIQLCAVKSFQKRLLTLLKIERCDFVRFKSKSTLLPQELQLEIKDISHHFPATMYTHFLRFLCHYHLTNRLECRDSLRDLQRTITKSDRIITPTAKAVSYICLGKAFQLHGDKDSATNAFHQAYEFESFGVKKIAQKRLSLIK
ncbi:uncharacterized protein LOC127734817 [Mytilus californianus]|uniref:uncharacterized protein LOC127734817 n=1 Tax=Mytilus californianus TaxID=6549 RepID=UPI002245DBCF|nr:uncharacterized protein LOC127734817 [Mytilus californianus]